MIPEPVSPVILLIQPVFLNHGTHSAIEHQDLFDYKFSNVLLHINATKVSKMCTYRRIELPPGINYKDIKVLKLFPQLIKPAEIQHTYDIFKKSSAKVF